MKPDSSTANFTEKALTVFRHQAKHNTVYAQYISGINCNVENVKSIADIPFLPISFFKTHTVVTGTDAIEKTFYSSGTTGLTRSKHHITAIKVYEKSFRDGFSHFFGNIEDYTILALLPSYQEQENSSLVYMIQDLISLSKKEASGFYLENNEDLINTLLYLEQKKQKTILIGVSYALLDLIEKHQFNLKHTLIMETGGMKGRQKELIKEALHKLLKVGFGVSEIHSEYGMTELLSQAYSIGTFFRTPPWMKVLIREVEDPLSLLPVGKSGGINIIDLNNINSCSFIATQDLGKTHPDGSFEVLGRFDHSDIRGCNLML